MDFRKLRYFVAVATSGGFSKAATSIQIAQPALSRQIKQLEDDLHAPLFYRNGRGVRLTAAGELLLAYAIPALEANAQIEREIAGLSGSPQGTLTLGILPSLSSSLLKPLMMLLSERYPMIKLNVRIGMSGTVLDWLQNGKVDIAVIYDVRRPGSIIAEHLLVDDFFLVRRPSGASKPITGEALQAIPLVMPGRMHGIRAVIDSRMAALNYEVDVRFEIDSIQVIKDMVIEGKMQTVLPYGAVAQEVEAGLLEAVEIVSPRMQRHLVLATATNSSIDTSKRLVISAIHSVAEDLAKPLRWKTSAPLAMTEEV